MVEGLMIGVGFSTFFKLVKIKFYVTNNVVTTLSNYHLPCQIHFPQRQAKTALIGISKLCCRKNMLKRNTKQSRKDALIYYFNIALYFQRNIIKNHGCFPQSVWFLRLPSTVYGNKKLLKSFTQSVSQAIPYYRSTTF